jgi:hypothetical protein|uniref:mRNA capping enzyme adenylation domain-containing protein n=1 Tax=viral metagenome TaxID=1070528 RepID=A0A6C0EBX6_9ZZZZ
MSSKKIILGNDFGYIIDNNIKNKIIDYLYSKIDLSKYRYCMLNNIQKLNFLQENIHYVSPNFKGFNYLLIIIVINNNRYCVIIDRKKLSYHKNQLDLKNLQIIQLKLNISENNNTNTEDYLPTENIISNSIFNGTIFDGKLINSNNNYIFLIQDCLYLMGHQLIDMEMNNKMNYLDSIIKTHFKKKTDENSKNTNIFMNFDFKLNKLYNYNELNNLINNFDKIKLQTSGLIFFPKLSGINIIHIEKKIEKIDYSINKNEIIDNKTYNIIYNYVDFLKSRVYSYENIDDKNNNKNLWLNKSTIPDVYYISEDEKTEKIGIALIPNLKISQLCDNLINDNPIQFICTYSNKFKKWIPIKPL